MTCDEARERMVFFVDGEDDAVGGHVAGCASCRELHDEVAAERRLIGRALRPQTRRLAARRPSFPWWPVAAAGAVLFAVVIVATQPRRQPEPSVTKRQPVPREESRVEPEKPPEPIRPPPIEPKPEPKEPAPDPKPEPKPEPVKPEPTPDDPRPEPPKPEPKPTEPAKRVEVALALEKGSAKNLKWEGRHLFLAGEQIQAKTSMRIDWSGADLYVREGSTLTIDGVDAFTVESGEILVESAGVKLTVQAGGIAFANTGTRFLVAVDGKQTTAQVFEGRLSAGTQEIVAGERAVVKGTLVNVEPAKELYPAWMARTMARRIPVVAFDFKSPDKRLAGTVRDGALHGREQTGQCYTGVEQDDAILAIPAKGEYWVTYWTESTEPITLRVRILKGESTAFDYIIAKPVTGRAVAVRIPLAKFRSRDGKSLAAGDSAHILYVFTKEMSSKLRIDDLSVVELKE